MTGTPVRGGKSGKSIAPKKTLYKAKDAHPMWKAFMGQVKKFREEAGVTPQEAADALGVSIAKIYIWENAKSTPHPHDLCVYLEFLGAKGIDLE